MSNEPGAPPSNREQSLAPFWGLLVLLAAFLLLYEPWQAGVRELFRQEGFYAAQTLEMDARLPLSTAHGVAIRNAFPLYPLIGGLLCKLTGLPVEFALRLLSALMAAAEAALIYFSVRQARSTTAAQAAAAMFLSANIVVEKSLEAYPTSMVALAVFGAQLLWFYWGVRRANWNLAWLSSLSILSVAFYAGGFGVLVSFFFPLIFMRRPLSVWPKCGKPGLPGGLLIFAGVVGVWWLPYLVFSPVMPFQYWSLGSNGGWEYLEQLVSFPFDALVRFLPWGLVAWAPFCVALHQQDETPIFSRYLRTIVISMFLLLWLLPGTDSADLMLLAGPLAMVTGFYYEAAVRRYSRQIRMLLRLCGVFVLGVTAALLFFCLLPEGWIGRVVELSRPIAFKADRGFLIRSLAVAALMLPAGLWLLSGRRRDPVWLRLLVTTVCGGLFFWSAMFPYRTQENSKRAFGLEMRRVLEQDGARLNGAGILYKSDILDLYGECRYLGLRVQKINDLSELPKAAETVYLLSTEFPQMPERLWSNLLAPGRVYLKHRVGLWKGVLRRDSLPASGTVTGGLLR